MSKLKVNQYVVGPVSTNCYFAVNQESKEAIVIDPGASAEVLMHRMIEEGITVSAILLTHGHFDHAGAAAELAKKCNVPVYAHAQEQDVLESAELNASWMMGLNETYCADVYLKDGQEIDLAGFHIRVMHTPGHTKGGCCYYFSYEDAVFVGDTLFAGSVGRTDLATGSMSELITSIRENLMVLPEETIVYPGHGDVTTVGEERMYNPYL